MKPLPLISICDTPISRDSSSCRAVVHTRTIGTCWFDSCSFRLICSTMSLIPISVIKKGLVFIVYEIQFAICYLLSCSQVIERRSCWYQIKKELLYQFQQYLGGISKAFFCISVYQPEKTLA